MRGQRPVVNADVLGADEVRVFRSGPLGVEEDLEGVGAAVHVDGQDLGVSVVLVGDLTLRLDGQRRVGLAVIQREGEGSVKRSSDEDQRTSVDDALSDRVELLKLEVLVGRVDDLDDHGLASEGEGGGGTGSVNRDGGVLRKREEEGTHVSWK